jgi:hypothetical protein
MAWQRRGQRARHRGGWGRRRHLVLLLLGLSGACGGERSLFAPVDRVTGTGGRDSGDARLVGEWETILLVDVPGDRQTWTTTWVFRDDLTCRFTRSILSIAEGVPRVTIRTCTWRTANATVLVTYTDPLGTVSTLPYDFVSFDPNRLLLEGIEYRRVSR